MSKDQQRSKYREMNMKKNKATPVPLLLIIGGLILLGGAIFGIWKAGQPTLVKLPVQVEGSPSLRVDRELVDFGDVPVEEFVSVTFNLSNIGDEDLRFQSVPYVEVVEGC
jgi:hypothetical protein